MSQTHRTKFEWNDYFNATPVTTFGPNEYNSNQTLSGSNVHVLNCLFNKCTSTSYGGALYCTSNYLLVESSSFFSCNTSGTYGGAIYFSNTGSGECVLHGVCGNDCCSTSISSSLGQFASVYVKDTSSGKNCVNYSSIVRCVNKISSSRDPISLNFGKICCQSTNISMNKCYYRPGFLCQPFKDLNSVTCSLSYSTFADNNAIFHTCILLLTESSKYEIKYCNILRNTQEQFDSVGTIYTTGNLTIEDSCIVENKANNIFYSEYSSIITLLRCTVDNITYYGNLTVENTVTKSFIFVLKHMSTENCHAEYDFSGYQIAIPYVLDSPKKMFCYSCKNNHYQSIISDSFSLIFVFIFTFINPNPSGYF